VSAPRSKHQHALLISRSRLGFRLLALLPMHALSSVSRELHERMQIKGGHRGQK
jgi:hypothetical protein